MVDDEEMVIDAGEKMLKRLRTKGGVRFILDKRKTMGSPIKGQVKRKNTSPLIP